MAEVMSSIVVAAYPLSVNSSVAASRSRCRVSSFCATRMGVGGRAMPVPASPVFVMGLTLHGVHSEGADENSYLTSCQRDHTLSIKHRTINSRRGAESIDT